MYPPLVVGTKVHIYIILLKSNFLHNNFIYLAGICYHLNKM
jgi:hypothetical protein